MKKNEMKKFEPWKEEDMVLSCIHVIENMREPEVLQDDSYVCSPCRDMLSEGKFEELKPTLSFVHRTHLEGNSESDMIW